MTQNLCDSHVYTANIRNDYWHYLTSSGTKPQNEFQQQMSRKVEQSLLKRNSTFTNYYPLLHTNYKRIFSERNKKIRKYHNRIKNALVLFRQIPMVIFWQFSFNSAKTKRKQANKTNKTSKQNKPSIVFLLFLLDLIIPFLVMRFFCVSFVFLLCSFCVLFVPG